MIFSKFTEVCDHHQNPVLDPVRQHTMIPNAHLQPIPVPSSNPRQPLPYVLSLEICLFETSHINRIIQCRLSCVWLLSLTIVFLRFTQVVARISSPLSLLYCSTVSTYHVLFFYSPVDGHLDSFSLLVMMNNAAINVHAQAFAWTYVFMSLGQTPRSGIAGLYSKFMFNFLKDHQTVFQRSQTT